MLLGGGNTASAFARLPLPGMPFYTGTPWFMPVAKDEPAFAAIGEE